MNHQPFEKWLLADEPPEGEQAIEIKEHLQDCQRCRSLEANWNDVHQMITISGQIAPAPGFTTRFEARLQAQQELELKRKNHRPWLLFMLNIGIATALLGLLGFQLWRAFNTPAQLLLVKAFFLSILVTVVKLGSDILSALVQVAVRFPAVQWAFLLGMSGFLGMLWVTIGRQLVSIRRISL
jgi:predicted anti-sigma-YlaC factor YlaD